MENKETIEMIRGSSKMIPIYDPLTLQIVYVSEETYKKMLETVHKMTERIKQN